MAFLIYSINTWITLQRQFLISINSYTKYSWQLIEVSFGISYKWIIDKFLDFSRMENVHFLIHFLLSYPTCITRKK